MGKDIYSVTQLNTEIHKMFVENPMFDSLAVVGEVSKVNLNKSGHLYFTLKDENSVISVAMWKSTIFRGGLPNDVPKNGDKVLVRGRVDTYVAGGSYQIIANRIEPDGEGDIDKKLKELAKKLQEEGMFDDMYKKTIPAYAKRIGVVTSPTGAAIRDIIRVCGQRNPHVQIILSPAQVQGTGAALSIVEALARLDAIGVDVIIIGRGGGSAEDLWAFNEEITARAVFRCKTPVISAVGHDIDKSITDMVADLHAATPSQAAEFACFSYLDVIRNLQRYEDQFNMIMDGKIVSYRERLTAREKQLALLLPTVKLEKQKAAAKNYYVQLNQLIKSIIDRQTGINAEYAAKLDGLSPLKRLAEGYGYVSMDDGSRVTSARGLNPGDVIFTQFADGKIKSEVSEVYDGGPLS